MWFRLRSSCRRIALSAPEILLSLRLILLTLVRKSDL
jgi:hypothetical protein